MDLKQIEGLERSVKDLEEKYNDILGTSRAIKYEMEEQSRILKNISGVPFQHTIHEVIV